MISPIESFSVRQFRSSAGMCGALKDFLDSNEGVEVLKTLRAAHPLTLLAEANSDAHAVRESAATETVRQDTPANLLGKLEGFEMCLNLLKLLATPMPETPPQGLTSRQVITQTLRR